jgi:hypothetical protein
MGAAAGLGVTFSGRRARRARGEPRLELADGVAERVAELAVAMADRRQLAAAGQAKDRLDGQGEPFSDLASGE